MTPAADLARTLVAAVQQSRHYGSGHPAARQAAAQLHRVLHAGYGGSAVRVEVGPRTVSIQSSSLPTEDSYGIQLRVHLAARRVGVLIFHAGVTEDAVAAFTGLLALEPEELVAAGGLAEAMLSAGLSGITAQSAGARSSAPQDPYAVAAQTMLDITAAVEVGEPVDMPRARLTVEGLAAVLETQRQELWRQVADRGHDELDPAHAVNTCILTLRAGAALELPHDALLDLGTAALLHDIGLSALPWSDRLRERTAAGVRPEWRHPAEGAFVLRHLGGRESLPMIVAAEHHLPAVGDPHVLPQSRLVALTDYVDAMTCGRVPAMRAMPAAAVVEQLLRGQGPGVDPVHVRVLAALLREQEAAGVPFTAAV